VRATTEIPTTTATSGKAFTAPSSQIWAWGIGALACHLLIQTYGQASVIFTVGFGLSPVIISWCMMLPRVVDGILDPIMGHLSDETHTRWGRRKPYLVLGAILGALFLMSVWWANPAWSQTAQFAYLLALGTLFYVAYGIYTMAWTAMGYELTDDYNERSKVAAIGGLFLAIVTLSVQWMYWLALREGFHAGLGETARALWGAGLDWAQISEVFSRAFADAAKESKSEIWGMRWISALSAAIIVISAFVATWFCRERFTHVNRTHIPIGPAVKATVKNRPFVILLGFKIAQILGDRAALGLLVYLAIYYICGGDKGTATKITGLGATIGTILGFFVLPVLKPITAAIGKRNAQIVAAGIAFAMAVALPFILTPAHPYWLMIPTLVAIPLSTLNNALTNSIVPDICDVDELQCHQRREGLFTAVMGFIGKMEISLCYLLVGYIVSWAGLDTKLATQPSDVLHRLYWLCVVQNLVFSLGALVLAILFPVTPETMREVRQKLDARRLEEAVAGEPTDEVVEQIVHEHPEIAEAARHGDSPSQVSKSPPPHRAAQ